MQIRRYHIPARFEDIDFLDYMLRQPASSAMLVMQIMPAIRRLASVKPSQLR
jgi:hypothetical protein